MDSKQALEAAVMTAARDNGINSVLFRNAVGRKLGLNIADSECLSFLTIKGVATPTELAQYTGLTTGSTTAMLDRLERDHFIVRKPNPQDRRGILIEVSQHWRETSSPLVIGIQQAQRALLATYSAQELTIIADFLQRFSQNVAEHTNRVNDL